ncbi:tetratricopeptide repeat protein [candidate division KSB1 bacterium]|nr:tetratricopeptide repeat protein [candidate division KSB1 bacterium]NIR71733.1 tetratricopeptide repeat protein [candidate division KSB1 bacterium]NIS26414.1 tetratricopeptide repeat protein [candidate division KSB1 bacterium]NIT73173.1 tetratricopeptide repeat protein [candidate division KSB1 bacterium]NIU27100.1 tetratricopeptide repeat protein [candidate division KSB1 bacterium]
MRGNSFARTTAILILPLLFATTLQGQEAEEGSSNQYQELLNAISENEALLAKYPDSDFTSNLMFQLGELYVKKARYEFQKEMAKYEEAERKYDQGLLEHEPTVPRVNFSEALKMCYDLLEKYPNVPFRDKVMYRIAICHLDEGNKEKSIEYLENLSAETTEKQYLEEAYFRLGEYYFEQRDYATAIDYYKRLINSWDSPYFDMALYKLGWSYYNVDDYAQAISTLIYLIDDVNLLEEVSVEHFGKTNADLRREAIEYVAVCFADYSGPQKAREFLSERKEKAYTEQILLNLARVYQARNFYDEATESLKILLDFYPNKPNAPIFQKRIVDNYQLAGEKDKADEARVRFIAKYGPGTKWFDQSSDDSLRQNALEVAEEFLYTLGTDAQAKAQKTKSKLQYGLAVNRYQSYLQKFPDSERSSKVRLYRSECLFELGRYKDAAESYEKVVANYPESEFRETAAYNRILSYNEMMEKTGVSRFPAFVMLKNFLGKYEARVDTIEARGQAEADFIKASNDFVMNFSSSPKVPEVLMKFGEVLYELEAFPLAKATYKEVINHPTAGEFIPQAYSMIAQTAFKQNNYEESEEWYRKLSQQYPDSSRYVEKANKMIASSRFKVAETYLAQGDSSRAAEEFERVANVVSDPNVSQRALFEAALLYEDIGELYKAVLIYESMYSKFPNSDLVDKSLFKAGVLCRDLQDWRRAAKNFVTLYNYDKNSRFASKGLYFAAKSYENVEDYETARNYYNEYVKSYNHDPDRFLEAAFRKGEIAYNRGRYQEALQDFRLVTNAYQKFAGQNITTEKYLVANAQFLIGEILYNHFHNIELRQPLERSLKRKRARFEQVIKAYAGAAKYKVADWTTASSHKIGQTFEEFANTLLDSPRPANLDESKLAEYNQKLWENVLPFKKKALSTYQANVKQAMENNIENKWVMESKERMEALTVELSLGNFETGKQAGS